jgi:hypothetical protein
MNQENQRLKEARQEKAEWKKWGPYLSERQWGTVREDYSENGDAASGVRRHGKISNRPSLARPRSIL